MGLPDSDVTLSHHEVAHSHGEFVSQVEDLARTLRAPHDELFRRAPAREEGSLSQEDFTFTEEESIFARTILKLPQGKPICGPMFACHTN